MDSVYNGLMSECVHLESLSSIVAELDSFVPLALAMDNKRRQKQLAFNRAFKEFFRYRCSVLGFFDNLYFDKDWNVQWEDRFWLESGLPASQFEQCSWLASQPRKCMDLVLHQYYKLVASKLEHRMEQEALTVSDDDDDCIVEETREELTVTILDSGEIMDAGDKSGKGVVRVVRRKVVQENDESTRTSTQYSDVSDVSALSSSTGTAVDLSSSSSGGPPKPQPPLPPDDDDSDDEDRIDSEEAWNDWKREYDRENRMVTMKINGKAVAHDDLQNP